MSSFAVPPAAVPAEIPRRVPLQIVSSSPEPPEGDGWLHEVKHDGHRLLAIVAGGELRLLRRNGLAVCRFVIKYTSVGLVHLKTFEKNDSSRYRPS